MKKYIQEHKYVLLVLYLPIYLIWFALVERMVPSTEGCFVSYLPLDEFSLLYINQNDPLPLLQPFRYIVNLEKFLLDHSSLPYPLL